MTRADTSKYGRYLINKSFTLYFIDLKEQVAVGLYYILTGSCSSKTKFLQLGFI